MAQSRPRKEKKESTCNEQLVLLLVRLLQTVTNQLHVAVTSEGPVMMKCHHNCWFRRVAGHPSMVVTDSSPSTSSPYIACCGLMYVSCRDVSIIGTIDAA